MPTRAESSGESGVLALHGGRDDPRHLGEPIGGDVGAKVVGVGGCDAASGQFRVRILCLLEAPHHAVEDDRGDRSEVFVVVDLPAHTCLTEVLRHRAPAVGELRYERGCFEKWAAMGALRVEGCTHPVEPVGVGGAENGAVVGVADRECLGEGAVDRDVVALVVAHECRCVGGADRLDRHREPAVVAPAVPRLVQSRPRVVGVVDAFAVKVGVVLGVEAEGHRVTRLRRSYAGCPSVLAPQRRRLAESADTRVGAEIVVEAAILLHEQDDVLDVVQ